MTSLTYRLFGLKLVSNHAFVHLLAPKAGFPMEVDTENDQELVFTCRAKLREPLDLTGLEPLYTSPNRTSQGESVSHLYRLDGVDILRFPGVADFHVGPRAITCYPFDTNLEYLIELRLLGPVLSYWLECRGIRALHASGIETGGRVAGFLSSHGGGKTSLAAQLMADGHSLISDDILPVEEKDGVFFARSGYPQMRMWPAEAEFFRGRYEDLSLVHPAYTKRRMPVGDGGLGRFCDACLPLLGLYLPERFDAAESRPEIKITPLTRRDAVIELIRHSFNPLIVEAAGLQPEQLDFFSRLVRHVPVWRLSYPSGMEYLPTVTARIREDFRA